MRQCSQALITSATHRSQADMLGLYLEETTDIRSYSRVASIFSPRILKSSDLDLALLN